MEDSHRPYGKFYYNLYANRSQHHKRQVDYKVEQKPNKTAYAMFIALVLLLVILSFVLSILYGQNGQGQRSTAVNVSNIFETSVRYTNLVFTSELANNRSEVYLNTSKMVCAEMKTIFITYLKDFYSSFCEVISFRPGSIIPNFQLKFNFGSYSVDSITSSRLIRSAIQDGIKNQLISSAIDPSSTIVNAIGQANADNICAVEKPCDQICTLLGSGASQTYQCACSDGYKLVGNKCKANDACTSQPCFNRGSCVPGINGDFACICPQPYAGKDCSNVLLPCKSSPCLNGGTCFDTITGGYSCGCLNGYTGQLCQTMSSTCMSSPCLNGGRCVDLLNGSYLCNCPIGYNGELCQEPKTCFSSPCINGGSCFELLGGYFCHCPTEFFGSQCQTSKAVCNNATCANGGTCYDLFNGNITCSCPPGFTGNICQTSSKMCTNETCANRGTCYDLYNGSIACSCEAGYTGSNCKTNINSCQSSPCSAGATCVNGVSSYACVCPPLFFGLNCNLSCNCQNGGTCNAALNSVTCTCLQGFTGTLCQILMKDAFYVIANPMVDSTLNWTSAINYGNAFTATGKQHFVAQRTGLYWMFYTVIATNNKLTNFSLQDSSGNVVSNVKAEYSYTTDTHSNSILLNMTQGDAIQATTAYDITSDVSNSYLITSWGGFNIEFLSPTNEIAFLVVATSKDAAESPAEQFVNFQSVLLNVGSAWHSDVNRFVAPVCGIYYFSVTFDAYQSNNLYLTTDTIQFVSFLSNSDQTHNGLTDIVSAGRLLKLFPENYITVRIQGPVINSSLKFMGFLYSPYSMQVAWIVSPTDQICFDTAESTVYWYPSVNVGAAWQSTKNLVIIPISGTYFIEIVANPYGTDIDAILLVNDAPKLRILLGNGADNSITRSAKGLFDLAMGDQLKYIIKSSCTQGEGVTARTLFQGFLIYLK